MLPSASRGRQAGLPAAPSVFRTACCKASLCDREETRPAADRDRRPRSEQGAAASGQEGGRV